MLKKLLILTFAILLGTANAAPSKTTTPEPPPSPQEQRTVENMQLLNPHVITIERFESLLRRAGELFRPAASASYQLMRSAPAADGQITQQVAASTPYLQHMQPPTEEPYNFYLPLFQYENVKLDAKSRQLENIAPPPAPSNDQDQTDYYSAKPKKLPKKFVGTAKQVNINWLNALEKGTFADPKDDDGNESEVPKAVYMVNDERNRINFDDSFFGVDMQVKIPADNEPHKDAKNPEGEEQAQPEDAFLNQGEEMGEDDLLAAAAVQVPQINYDRVPAKA